MMSLDLKSLFSNTNESESIAKSFTVKSIMNPLNFLELSELDGFDIPEMAEMFEYSRFVIITENESVIGVQDLYDDPFDIFEELDDKYENPNEAPIKERYNIKDIMVDNIISSDLNLIDLFPLLVTNEYCFILEKNSLVGYVSYVDIDKLPVKMYLFSLLLELEANISNRLRGIKNLDAYLVLLSDASINKIKRMIKIQNKLRKESDLKEVILNFETGESEEADENKISSYDAIKYLNIEEKQFLLREYMAKEQPLTDEEVALMDKIFNFIKRVRNLIAHGESILKELKDPSQLDLLLTAMLQLNESYKKA